MPAKGTAVDARFAVFRFAVTRRAGTGGIFARTRATFPLGRDAKMRPVPLVGRPKGTGRFFASRSTTDSDSLREKAPRPQRLVRPEIPDSGRQCPLTHSRGVLYWHA